MCNFNEPKIERGFTQLELLIAIVIIGILAAISAPSFLGMLNRNKVNNAVTSLQGALKEAQREAMRKSKKCTVTLSATKITSTDGCLPTGDRIFENGVKLSHNQDQSITYGIRGNINTTDNMTMTIYYTSDGEVVGEAKCITLSSPLGIVRIGNYKSNLDPTKPTNGNINCQK